MAGSIITQDELKELLHYDPDTGIFTRIKCDKRKDRIGEVAGGVHRFGYWIIKLNLKEYKAHRLAWLYMTGRWPLNQIDHINRIRTDNRFSNLRECSNSENCKNMSKNKKNTSGYKGVSFDSRKKKWKARCSVDKVRCTSSDLI